MITRKDLHDELERALGSDQVYFQPPANVRMKYPAIVYTKTEPKLLHANGKPYTMRPFYNIVVISSDPDNTIIDEILKFPTARPGRRYVAENLYHDPCTIYI